MTNNTLWFVRLQEGRVRGPYSEFQIRRGIQQGQLDDSMRLRQGESDWIRVAKVRKLFQSLQTDGIYIRDARQNVSGPYTLSRFRTMRNTGELPPSYSVRRGCVGHWTPAAATRPAMTDAENNKPRPVIPAAPVMKLRTLTWSNFVQRIGERFEKLVLRDTLASS